MSEEDDLTQLTTQSFTDKQAFKISQSTKKKLTNDQLLWNILPSYDFFVNQFMESNEPPHYDDAPSSVSLSTTSSLQRTPLDSLSLTTATNNSSLLVGTQSSDPERILIDEASNQQWRETILDHVDYLNNMTTTDNQFTNHLKVECFFTKDLVETNVKPEIIEPKAYKQGDSINGFITVENTLDQDIRFNLFYILLEGIISLKDGKTTRNTKFLEMFDIIGSYHDGHVSRLVSEYIPPHTCPDSVDADGHYNTFSGRVVKAKRKYKRFFSFKIPNQLLDQQCDHNLPTHLNVIPTVGNTKDFSPMGDLIKYQVSTIFIGKAKYYNYNPTQKNAKIFNKKGDEFVILKDTHHPLHITPTSQTVDHVYQTLVNENFNKRIEEMIKIMEKFALIESNSLEPAVVREIIENFTQQVQNDQGNKVAQLYYPPDTKAASRDLELTCKSGSILKSGEVKLITPLTTYNFQTPLKGCFSIPFNISSNLNNTKIKNLRFELACVTYRSLNTIPLEISHDLIFKNDNYNVVPFNDMDIFKHNITDHYVGKFNKIKDLSKKTNIENFRFEKSLIRDLRTAAQIQDKTINLLFKQPKIMQNGELVKFPKLGDFEVCLDLNSLTELGGNKEFNLGPSFQSCYMGRVYYLRIWIGLNNGDFCFKLPVSVNN